jgi:hypothetical protein
MAKTIEKITETDPPKKNGNGVSVNAKIQLGRARFRFLLAILILGVYSAAIYMLFVHSGELNDKISSLLQVMIGALTVVLSQLAGFYYGDASSDMNGKEEEKDSPVLEQRVDITAPNQKPQDMDI